MKFIIVGGLGTLTNLLIFTLLVTKTDLLLFDFNFFIFLGVKITHLDLEKLIASVFCFWVAASQNYLFNEKWTFSNSRVAKIDKKRYRNFVFLSLIALSVNVTVLMITSRLMQMYFFPQGIPTNTLWEVTPQAVGILSGVFINFIVSKKIVFKKEK